MNLLRLLLPSSVCCALLACSMTAVGLEKSVPPIGQSQFGFHSVSAKVRLSQNQVTAITQDSIGYVWLGTPQGLDRFDGYEVRSYYDSSADDSLSHSSIWKLATDSIGRLWVGTDSGLNLYDRKTDSFQLIPLVGSESEPRIFDIVEASDGRILIGASTGLYQLQEDVTLASFSVRRMLDVAVRAVIEDELGVVWVGTENSGLLKANTNSTFSKVEGSRDTLGYIRKLVVSNDNDLWVATFHNGVFRFSSEGKVADHFAAPVLGSSRVRGLLSESQTGAIWIGTDKGLSRWDPALKQLLNFQHDPSASDSVPKGAIYDLFEDAGGVIWVGAFAGLSIFKPSSTYIPLYTLNGLDNNDSVSSFAESSSGEVAIGTFSGVVKWEPSEGLLKDFYGVSDQVMSLEYDSADLLWIGTLSSGVFVFEENELVARFSDDAAEAFNIGVNGVTDILLDAEDRIWLSTYGSGVYLVEVDGIKRGYPDTQHITGAFTDLKCLEIEEVAPGEISIGTESGGVMLLNAQTGDVRSISDEMRSKNVPSLLHSSYGLWAGSLDSGLSLLLGNEKSKNYPHIPGSKTNEIFGIAESPNADGIWFSNSRSIYRFRMSGEEFFRFDQLHGVQAGDLNLHADLTLSTGHILFGGNDGVNVIDVAKLSPKSAASPLVMTSLSISNMDYKRGLPLVALGSLSHNQNSISASFSVFDYLSPSSNRYSHRLEGFENDWVDSGANRHIAYTNLDPGNYVLLVNGANSDGVWGRNPVHIPFKISPPPWATWWAYTVYILLGLFFFYQALSFNTKRVKREASDSFNKRMQNYVFSLDETSECVLNANSKGNILFMNTAASEILGLSPSQLLGHPLFKTLFQLDAERDLVRKMLVAEGTYQDEVRYTTRDGQAKVLEVGLTKIEPAALNEVAYVSVVRDVTEKSSERERSEKLVAELSHKTDILSQQLGESVAEKYQQERKYIEQISEKNEQLYQVHDRVHDNFQMLASLLSIQIGNTLDAQQQSLIEEVQQRIFAVALVHENMLRGGELERVDMAKYLDALVVGLYRSHAPTMVTVELRKEIEEFELPMEQAVPCGLIVNELVTNALDHAWADKQFGSGLLSFHCICSGADCVVTIADDGHGLPVGFKVESGESMGMEIASILIKQLGGTLRLIGGPGTTLELRFPL